VGAGSNPAGRTAGQIARADVTRQRQVCWRSPDASGYRDGREPAVRIRSLRAEQDHEYPW